MDDFLAGPEHIFSILESALPDVHEMRQEYPDAVVLPAPPRCRRRRTSGRKKVKIPTNPLGDRVRLGPRRAAPTQASTTPRTIERPQLNVADPGRAVVPAVQGRRRHRHHRRRPRRGVPAARPRENVCAAACVAAPADRGWPASSTDAQGLPRGAAGAVAASRSGKRCSLESSPGQWLRPSRARKPRWWPCSRRWPTGPACWPARVAFRTSVSTASAGSRWPRLGALLQPDGAAGVACRRRGSVPRACRRGGDQAGGQARTPASPGGRRQRRHAEPAELPVRTRHVDHRSVDTAGAHHRACPYPRCWCRRWRCPAWCSACTTPATCSPASPSGRSSRRRSEPSLTGLEEAHEHLE